MQMVQENGRNGIRWKINNKLNDLDFADDIALVILANGWWNEEVSNLCQ